MTADDARTAHEPPPPPPRHDAPPPRHEPPPGWDDYRPGAGQTPPPRASLPDLGAILALLETLRTTVPPELRDQFNALVREVLLTIRSLIDWYLERVDSAPREARAEDIPLD